MPEGQDKVSETFLIAQVLCVLRVLTFALLRCFRLRVEQITFNTIKQRLKDTMSRLGSQKFYDPADGRDYVESELSQIEQELNRAFKGLMEEFR